MKGKIIMTNKNSVNKNTFAPYNYNALLTTKVGHVIVSYDDNASVEAYEIKFDLIKDVVKNPIYARFTIGDYNLRDAFNIVARNYKEGKIVSAQKLYRKVIAALQEYNDALIQGITIQLKLKDAARKEEFAKKRYIADKQIRWTELSDKAYGYYDNLTEEQRQVLLDHAADYGIYPEAIEMNLKDVYCFQPAPVIEEADDIHPWVTYLEPDKIDPKTPYVTVVGKFQQTVTTRAAENEAFAICEWLAQYGDEFLMKTTTPNGVVTHRDIRLGLVDDEPLEFRDFQYEPNYEEDENDFMNGTEL